MTWIVVGQDKGKWILVSKGDENGSLYIGHYITIEDKDENKKFILRVDDSRENFPYSPSPMIVDMDLSPLVQDQKTKNIIYASRVMEIPERDDGKASFIKPQSKARISNQDEIDAALGNTEGIPVFPASVYGRNCSRIIDNEGNFVKAYIPEEAFFHQMLITGPTGSGKTVAMKYISQYFLENLKAENGPGAILAINVKEEDMLTMDKESNTTDKTITKEWKTLGIKPHGIDTFRIYFPGNKRPNYSDSVDTKKCEKITLKTENIDPETMTGLIQNISDRGADQLPSIFRYWQGKVMRKGEKLNDFIKYFADSQKNKQFQIMDARGESSGPISMHHFVYNNVLNALTYATEYFDIEGAKELQAEDILQSGKMSVIDVTVKTGSGFGFGSVLLRDLLEKIYNTKSEKSNKTPILIIIDEVHEFYGSTRGREALQTLDAISRKGRSLQIGIVFASQTLEDMPKGIENVVNTKISFKSIGDTKYLANTAAFDPESLKIGYAIASIFNMNQLKIIKFPMSLSGVNVGKR